MPILVLRVNKLFTNIILLILISSSARIHAQEATGSVTKPVPDAKSVSPDKNNTKTDSDDKLTPPTKTSSETKTSSDSPVKEEEVEYESYFTLAKYEPMQKYVNEFDHRLRFRMGVGFGQVYPGILTETGSSWTINSFLRSFNDGNVPPVFPINKVRDLATEPQYQEIAYGWKNKVDFSWSKDLTLGRYDQGSSASVNFLAPRTSAYWASGFEGNRLLRLEGISDHLRLSYTHPIVSFIMIGPSINLHRYTEKNEITNGSFTTVRSDNRSVWSVGGSASADYAMTGFLPGIFLKVQLKEWWEIRSRYEILDRKGNFGILGAQIVRQAGQSGENESLEAVIPFYSGNARDKGNLFMLESSFRYCRFTLDIGILRQDVKRSYSFYVGDTVGNLNPNDFSAKTRGLGIGEMGGSFRHRTTEIYIMPGFSFHFDEEGIY